MTHIKDNSIALVLGLLMLSGTLLGAWQVDAAPIELIENSINMFRDTRAANDDKLAQGDLFQFGANIVGGSLGTTVGAVYPPTGFTVYQSACQPSSVNPYGCIRRTAFTPNRLEPWTLIFQNGLDELRVSGPALLGINNDNILQPVPFPVDVTISGGGITPTISWTIPGGFVPDGFRVNIFDTRDHLQPNGSPDLIHSKELPNTATSYTLPAEFEDSGISLVDGSAPGTLPGLYVISFQLVETRDHVEFFGNPDILRRSVSYFNFSPLTDSAPQNVVLPTRVNGVYNFKATQVGPDSVTFIDPPAAIGYDYAIGPGDPNFKTVLLPEAGDNLFDLYLWNGSGYVFHATVGSGLEYTFPSGGVDRFRVLGIEASAALNPKNPTAFITGLRFVSLGQFTGTMTPIAAEALCATLGDDRRPSLLDQDIYTFQGTQGEEVKVGLEKSDDTGTDEQATLMLVDNIRGAFMLKVDNGELPNDVGGVLPATGEYLAIVAEQPSFLRGSQYTGPYCVTVQSSGNAAGTLQATGWVE